MSMEEEIKQLQDKTSELETELIHLKADVSDRIDDLVKVNHGLQADLDYQLEQNINNSKMLRDIRDLQEAVAKMANEPVGMMFDYRA